MLDILAASLATDLAQVEARATPANVEFSVRNESFIESLLAREYLPNMQPPAVFLDHNVRNDRQSIRVSLPVFPQRVEGLLSRRIKLDRQDRVIIDPCVINVLSEAQRKAGVSEKGAQQVLATLHGMSGAPGTQGQTGKIDGGVIG